MVGPRLVELSSTTLCSLGLPPHVGRGDAAVLRSTRSESFFDLITKLRAEDKELQERLADPLRRPPQSQLEIGIIDGKLTDVNPLDRIALLRVAEEIQDVGALPSPQAIELYVSTRQAAQARLRETDYPHLAGSSFNKSKGKFRECIEQRLLRYLPVARVPNCAFHDSNILGHPGQRVWHNALIADTASIDDGAFLATLESYYKAAREKERLDARGTPLTEADFANLRACVGGQMGELLEFLVCKGFDDETRRGLGISDGRARTSIARYDAVCARLPALRRAAEDYVQNKTIGTTGAGPTNERAAIHRRMQRLANELKLCTNQAQAAIATAKRRVRDDPQVLRALQAIVSNMGASFKAEDGLTPSDRAVLPADVDALWGTTGSQTERIHAVLQGYLSDRGHMISLAETKRLMRAADITCCKYVAKHDPVSIAQHFAARQKKTMRMIVVLFSAYAFSEGLDYKSLFSVNTDKNNRGRGEYMVKNERRETFSHGAGGDNLGKLALFSTLLRPVDVTDLVTLFQGDVKPEEIPGWKPEYFSAYPGLAVAFGHVHGTVGKALKETATSNMAHFWQKLELSATVLQSQSDAADYYRDKRGDPKPIMVQDMDNSHGASDLEHCFMLGFDFFVHDRDMSVGNSYAGQYSRFEAHEAVNGSLANRTNGAPIAVPIPHAATARTEELSDALEVCCDKLIAIANGATMKMGGGHVTVVRSELSSLGDIKARQAEVKKFIEATEVQKVTFKVEPMPRLSLDAQQVADLYRLVWRCMRNEDPATRIYLRSPHLVQWVKRAHPVNTFLKPPRAPAAFHSLLELWGGFLPVVVPSMKPEKQPDAAKGTGGSYAGLGESIERSVELQRLAGQPGRYYPPQLLDDLLKKPDLDIEAKFVAGTLTESNWSKLCDLLRQPRVSLVAEMERRMAMAKRKDANAELEKAQRDAGQLAAVSDYLLGLPSTAGGGDTRVPAMRAVLQRLGMPKRDVPKHRAQCIAEIFKRAKLTANATPPVPAAAMGAPAAMVATPTATVAAAAVIAPAPAVAAAAAAAAAAVAAAAAAAVARAAAAAAVATAREAAAERVLAELELEKAESDELAGGASSGSEEEQDVEEEESGELPPPPPVALATAEDAERLLDAVAVHAESPTSMWGCCGGVRNDSRTPYYCDGCNLYFHHGCAENQSKGRQAPLCPSCHAQALAGGRSARRRVAGP